MEISDILLFNVPQEVGVTADMHEFCHNLPDFRLNLDSGCRIEDDIYPLRLSAGAVFLWIEKNVKFEKVNKNGKFITRFEKALVDWAKKVSASNPCKTADWKIRKNLISMAFEKASRENKFNVLFSKNIIDAIRVNPSSCYMKSCAYSVDTIKNNSGFVMLSCDESGKIDYKSRAWIIPQFDSLGITGFILFNGYGWDTETAAKIFGEIISSKYTHVDECVPGTYTNSGYYFFNFMDDSPDISVKPEYKGEHNTRINGKYQTCNDCKKSYKTLDTDVFTCPECIEERKNKDFLPELQEI